MKESLSKERDDFWQEINILQNTEGFPCLTPKQQKIIICSLYLQDRSERDIHNYVVSNHFLYENFCHKAIQALENNNSLLQEEDLPADFFQADYYPIWNKSQAVQHIESLSFPTVVHIQRRLQTFIFEQPQHTFLALGHNKEGEIVIWEKEGLGDFPFRITNVEAELNYYGNDKFWGVRKLKNNQ
jgi:hypothetical protein